MAVARSFFGDAANAIGMSRTSRFVSDVSFAHNDKKYATRNDHNDQLIMSRIPAGLR